MGNRASFYLTSFTYGNTSSRMEEKKPDEEKDK